MFPTDQTHLRRYFATLGVAIAVGTLSLAGFFLQLQQQLLVTNSTLVKVTPTARQAILRRQEYLYLGTLILPWFVLVGFVGGIGLAIFGIAGWARRQKVIDEREDVGLRREKVELHHLTGAEREAKLDREVKESAREGSSGFVHTRSANVSNVRSEIIAIENALVVKLRELYGESDVYSSVGMQTPSGQRIEVDALVNRSTPIIFELKYASTSRDFSNRIRTGFEQLARAASLARGKGVLIIVSGDEVSIEQTEQWDARAKQMSAEYDFIIGSYVGRYTNFVNISADDFAARVGLIAPAEDGG